MPEAFEKVFAKMRHRITLETLTLTPDGAGGFESAWGKSLTLWAAVEDISGRGNGDITSSFQVEQESRKRFTVRYLASLASAISNRARICYNGAYYNILNISDRDEMRRFLEITAVSGGGNSI